MITLYSPAPPITRLHALNEMLGARLSDAGLAADVVPVPLPDAINRLDGVADRARRLPIVTNVDFLPAVEATGPGWHAYDRPFPELKLLASLYDVAFGITTLSPLIETPQDLRGQTVFAPPRPSSVRLLTEALLWEGWELEGAVTIADATPLDLGPAIGRGALKATSWNLTTREGATEVPNLRSPGARFLPVTAETVARLNERLHFGVGTCTAGGVEVLALRQGLAVWDDTPGDVAETVLDTLEDWTDGPFFCRPPEMADWPGIREPHLHPALKNRL